MSTTSVLTGVPTPGQVLAQIPAGCRRKRYLPGLTIFAADYLGYLGMLTGICLLPGWWLKGLCVLAAASLLGGLTVLGHDLAHGTLTPSRWLNGLLGRLAFLPSYIPFTGWQHAHNHLHHLYLRVRGIDMVWCPWSLEEYRVASTLSRWYYRFLRSPLGFGPYWIMENWLKHHMFPRDFPRAKLAALRFDRLLVVAFAIIQFGLLFLLTEWSSQFDDLEPLAWPSILVFAMVLPYLLWANLFGLIDLVHHTHPRMAWFNNKAEWTYYQANVASTAHILLPLKGNWLFHYILEHTAHHVDPRVPLYELPGAQAQLNASYAEDVVVANLTPSYVLMLFRTCQLYDFEKRCWLDYQGRPTSPGSELEANKKEDSGFRSKP